MLFINQNRNSILTDDIDKISYRKTLYYNNILHNTKNIVGSDPVLEIRNDVINFQRYFFGIHYPSRKIVYCQELVHRPNGWPKPSTSFSDDTLTTWALVVA